MDRKPTNAGRSSTVSLWVERSCLTLGALALLTVALVYADAWYTSTRAVAAFERQLKRPTVPEAAPPLARPVQLPPQESPASAIEASTAEATTARTPVQNGTRGLPLALLRAPRLGLEVPVFPGTDQVTLNHGAGLVEGTAPPDAGGNTVISGHRDSFFRPLKDLEVGDQLELVLPTGAEQRFNVQRIFVTDALDVSVLDPTAARRLTLVTCYPFTFVGFAPERLIVWAEPAPTQS